MFGYDGILCHSPVRSDFEQSLRNHQLETVRFEFGLTAVCAAFAGASLGSYLSVAQGGVKSGWPGGSMESTGLSGVVLVERCTCALYV